MLCHTITEGYKEKWPGIEVTETREVEQPHMNFSIEALGTLLSIWRWNAFRVLIVISQLSKEVKGKPDRGIYGAKSW
jgi:hypothetical protein